MKYGLLLVFLLVPVATRARDTVHLLPVQPTWRDHARSNNEWGDITVFFAGEEHSPVVKIIGEWRSHRKTHSIFRSDEDSCRIAFLSAVISLQKRAWKEGGNAVINVRSYDSASAKKPDYRCMAGATNAGVRLRGDVVRMNFAELTKFREQAKTKQKLPVDAPYPVESLGAFRKSDFRKAKDQTTGRNYFEINLLNRWQPSTLTEQQYQQLPE